MANRTEQRVIPIYPVQGSSTGEYREMVVDSSGRPVSPGTDATNIDQIAHNQVSVGSGGSLIVAERSGRSSVLIVNHGTTVVYLGGQNVNVTTGLYLAGVAGASVSIPGGAAIYGKAASGSQTVSYMEVF